jgi:hypothetical protein
LKWLELNKIPSSQPYTVFATAFRNAGVDSTDITVARENRALCERAARWLPLATLRPFCRDAVERRENGVNEAVIHRSDDPQSDWTQLETTLVSIPSDLVVLGFRGGLYFVADHGYRPGKVFWWVTVTLVIFWLWFIWPLNVVAFSSEPKSPRDPERPQSDIPKLRPLEFLFPFDRLLPAYQISSAHFAIESYFKRIAISQNASGNSPSLLIRRLLFFDWPVERVTAQQEIERVERAPRVLRLLGVVYAAFLAAAVSALFIH